MRTLHLPLRRPASQVHRLTYPGQDRDRTTFAIGRNGLFPLGGVELQVLGDTGDYAVALSFVSARSGKAVNAGAVMGLAELDGLARYWLQLRTGVEIELVAAPP